MNDEKNRLGHAIELDYEASHAHARLVPTPLPHRPPPRSFASPPPGFAGLQSPGMNNGVAFGTNGGPFGFVGNDCNSPAMGPALGTPIARSSPNGGLWTLSSPGNCNYLRIGSLGNACGRRYESFEHTEQDFLVAQVQETPSFGSMGLEPRPVRMDRAVTHSDGGYQEITTALPAFPENAEEVEADRKVAKVPVALGEADKIQEMVDLEWRDITAFAPVETREKEVVEVRLDDSGVSWIAAVEGLVVQNKSVDRSLSLGGSTKVKVQLVGDQGGTQVSSGIEESGIYLDISPNQISYPRYILPVNRFEDIESILCAEVEEKTPDNTEASTRPSSGVQSGCGKHLEGLTGISIAMPKELEHIDQDPKSGDSSPIIAAPTHQAPWIAKDPNAILGDNRPLCVGSMADSNINCGEVVELFLPRTYIGAAKGQVVRLDIGSAKGQVVRLDRWMKGEVLEAHYYDPRLVLEGGFPVRPLASVKVRSDLDCPLNWGGHCLCVVNRGVSCLTIPDNPQLAVALIYTILLSTKGESRSVTVPWWAVRRIHESLLPKTSDDMLRAVVLRVPDFLVTEVMSRQIILNDPSMQISKKIGDREESPPSRKQGTKDGVGGLFLKAKGSLRVAVNGLIPPIPTPPELNARFGSGGKPAQTPGRKQGGKGGGFSSSTPSPAPSSPGSPYGKEEGSMTWVDTEQFLNTLFRCRHHGGALTVNVITHFADDGSRIALDVIFAGPGQTTHKAEDFFEQCLNNTIATMEFYDRREKRLRILCTRRQRFEKDGGPTEFMTDDSLIGFIIGKQGESLAKIAKNHKVEIRVLPDENGYRRVRIYGPPIPSMRAKNDIWHGIKYLPLSVAFHRSVVADEYRGLANIGQRAKLNSIWVDYGDSVGGMKDDERGYPNIMRDTIALHAVRNATTHPTKSIEIIRGTKDKPVLIMVGLQHNLNVAAEAFDKVIKKNGTLSMVTPNYSLCMEPIVADSPKGREAGRVKRGPRNQGGGEASKNRGNRGGMRSRFYVTSARQ